MRQHTPAEIRAILYCFANLPASSYLELDLTFDQACHLLGQKGITLGIGEYWKVLHTGEESALLASLPDGYPKQKMWLCTLLWQRFWEMIIVCFPSLKQIAEYLDIPFPFAAPVELFACCLAESVNGDFSVCLQSYVEVSSPKLKKMFKNLARNQSFAELDREYSTPAGRKKIEREYKSAGATLRQSGACTSWFEFTLFFSFVLGRNSKSAFIESAVNGYLKALAELSELDAKQRHKSPSICWHKGVKKAGKRGGLYQ